MTIRDQLNDPPEIDLAAYNYAGAEKFNAPTSESAARMTDEQLSEQPIPDVEDEERVRIPRLNWNRSELVNHARTYGPLYIHEKVSPSEFVGTLLKENSQTDMFADFNGYRREDGTLADDASWYPYDYSGHWTNRLIRATAQRAMASLLYKDALRSKVDLIYMDPPYNISFRSNFQVAADTPETKETLDHIPSDPIAIRAYRDTYRDGIHSYLDGIYEQLILGRELLANSGSFIMQIGPDSLHQVALLMGEVFGTENHVATIPYRTTTNPSTRLLPEVGNWLIWYAKDKGSIKYHQLYDPASNRRAILALWQGTAKYEDPSGEVRNLSRSEKADPSTIPVEGRLFTTYPCHSDHTSTTGRSDIFYLHTSGKPCIENRTAWDSHVCDTTCDDANSQCPLGKECGPNCIAKAYACPTGSQWRVSHRGLHDIFQQGRMTPGRNIRWKHYEDDVAGRTLNAIWNNSGTVANKQYIVETPPKVLERCLLMTTEPGDLVLDLTCGSGAMPVQCETWGRRWIAVDVSAVSIAIARERVVTTLYPYHHLIDSPEGHKLDHEFGQELVDPRQRKAFVPHAFYSYDPAKGFVYERQMRVSAATLAYGPDLEKDTIYHQDRTMKENRRPRVATAFTMETDSPYRSVPPTEIENGTEVFDVEQSLLNNGFSRGRDSSVIDRITASMEVAGISQPGASRYHVENLQPTELPDVTHTGVLVTPGGDRHKAHLYIGAEDEIISSIRTSYAAQVTAETRGVDFLLMVGFERDEDALTINRKYPRLNVLQVDANRDLQLPYLKEDKQDNAFTIVSEPEVRLIRQPEGTVRLQVLGLNAFNPRTGMVEPPNARNVMCVMVDTAYDGESFRVRRMNVKRVKRNQKTLDDFRAGLENGTRQIDPAKWEMMETTTTVPFNLPVPGVKVAVKVIDQTGTKHMTILDDPHDEQWYTGNVSV